MTSEFAVSEPKLLHCIMPDIDTLQNVGRIILKGLVFLLLLVIYIPFYALLTIKLISKAASLYVCRSFNYHCVESPSMSLVSRKHRVADIGRVSTNDRLDFIWNRGMCYVHRMAWWTPQEVLKFLFREQTVEELTDEQLVYTLLTTVYSHHIKWNKTGNKLILDLSHYDGVVAFKGFFWETRKVIFDPDASEIEIYMSNGDVLRSTDDDEVAKQNYRLAKLHFQVCLSYFAPGLAHNHVHFVFPSSMCRAVKAKLRGKPDSFLRKLLTPHLRFTEAINFQALHVGDSTCNTRSFLDRFFFFWKSFPVTGEEFVEGVAKHCKKYYFEHLDDSEIGSEDNHREMSSIFPPKFVTDPQKQKIPYNYYLRKYYLVIEKFIQKIDHLIDRKEWEDVAQEVSKYVPGFDKVGLVHGLTSFIHQAAVVHSSDHETFARFIYKYGCMAIRCPFEKYSEEEEWDSVLRKRGCTLDQIKANPLLLLNQADVMRTRVFANVFGAYISNSCDQRLGKTQYDFDDEDAKAAADEFTKQLYELDEALKNEPPMANLSGLDETSCKGNQLAKLDKLVRSISF